MSTNIFSLRLAGLMETEKLSKRALAKGIGAQRKSVLDWLKGNYYPRYDALIKLANFFGTSTDYLLGVVAVCEKQDVKSYCALEEVPERFIQILNNYLKENNFSKYRLAKDVNTGESTLNRWFNNNSMPETEVIVRISRLLNESVDYLLGRE